MQHENDMIWLEALSNLRIPRYRSDVTAWHGHMPLAFFLIAAARPGVFVELGTHKGDSYCAFCQGVEAAMLSTRCFAVDTWRGDSQAGMYDENIYQDLKSYHDPLYGRFSNLMRCTFDEALAYFADGTVDLLHIDGLHTYEAVKTDFMKWLPKLSSRALVLFHDTQVREREFGVWRFWSDIKKVYPTFESPISHGLGVAAIGADVPSAIAPIFFDPVVARSVSELLAYAGSLVMESDSLLMAREKTLTKTVASSSSGRGEEPNTVFCQVFFGDGHCDFTEEESETREIALTQDGTSSVDVLFLLRATASRLRFDPVNCPSLIQHLELSLSSDDCATLRPIDHSLLSFVDMVEYEGEWACIGPDPQIILSGLSLQKGDLVRVRYKLACRHDSHVSTIISDWIQGLHRTVVKAGEESRLYLEQVEAKEEQHGQLLLDLQDKLSQVESLQSALKRANRDLYARTAELGRLEAMLSIGQSRRLEAEAKLTDQQSNYHDVLEQLRQTQSELSAMLGTKGWQLLNVLRTLRKFLRHPALTSRKLYASYRQLGMRTTVHRVADKLSRSAPKASVLISYDRWQRDRELQFLRRTDEVRREILSWEETPLVSIVMPTYNSETGWLQEAVSSLLSQPYHNWELVVSDDHSPNADTQEALQSLTQLDDRIRVIFNKENRGISGNTNVALAAVQGVLITFLDHDDILAPQALYEVVKAWNEHEFDILYSDEDKLGDEGYEDAFFKPDYSPDYLLSCNYFNHLTVYRRGILDVTGHMRSEFDGAQDYDLLLRATEVADTVRHVPQVLYHWRKVPGSTAASFDAKSYAHEAGRQAIAQALARRGEKGVVLDTGYPGHYRVNRAILGTPLVSIIIPMRDKPEVLRTCVDSVKNSSYRNLEIVIVDNGSKEPETLAYLSSLTDCRVLHYDIPFNYSRLNNWAAKEARGEYLLFLNNDVEVITVDWIEQMLQHAQRPEIGVVGAKLLYPDGRIQHAGVVLGIGGVADHGHKFSYRDSPGYFGTLIDARDYSAVTGACMLVKRDVFQLVGGFDEENLAVAFNDIDLCLKICEKGYFCVWTPAAQLYHYESLTRGSGLNYNEIFYMQRRWAHILFSDPYYNPHLTLSAHDFSFDPARTDEGSRQQTFEEVLIKSLGGDAGGSPEDDEAINMLGRILTIRPDLQGAFVKANGHVDVKSLLEWVVERAVYEDSAAGILKPYVARYKNMLVR